MKRVQFFLLVAYQSVTRARFGICSAHIRTLLTYVGAVLMTIDYAFIAQSENYVLAHVCMYK